MKLKFLLFLACFAQVFQLFAQKKANEKKKLKADDFAAIAGFGIIRNENFNPGVQNSFVGYDLKFPIENYIPSDGTNFILTRSFGAQFGFSIFNQSKDQYSERVKLMFGINGTQNRDGQQHFNQSRQRIDTVFLDQYNQQFSVDSFYNERFNYNYRFNQIRIESALQIYTSPVNQFQFYTGIGLGFAFSNKRSLDYSISNRVVNFYRSLSTDSLFLVEELPANNNEKNEIVTLPNLFNAFAYVPLGIKLRLGVGDSFLSRLSIFSEFRPMVLAETARSERLRWHYSISLFYGIRFNL